MVSTFYVNIDLTKNQRATIQTPAMININPAICKKVIVSFKAKYDTKTTMIKPILTIIG
jgi:hypothetical protein